MQQRSRTRRGWNWTTVTDERTGEKSHDLAAGLMFFGLVAFALATVIAIVYRLFH